MKKKMYIMPAIKVVEIKVGKILLGSDVKDASASRDYETLSREARFSRWEEEEDFE